MSPWRRRGSHGHKWKWRLECFFLPGLLDLNGTKCSCKDGEESEGEEGVVRAWELAASPFTGGPSSNMLAGKPPLSFLPSYNEAVVRPEAGAGSWISNSHYLLDSVLILPLLETYLKGHTDLWYGHTVSSRKQGLGGVLLLRGSVSSVSTGLRKVKMLRRPRSHRTLYPCFKHLPCPQQPF